MGKKSKVGKDRKDKFYKLAKETGFRSRAAFKLTQLNRRFGFLQRSQVCIDLCAAPGGWMQVAKQSMPMSSIVIGVDLFPIKPIPGCISLVEDITTDKCKQSLTKELQNWKADVILHDGAPNVGKNWLFDAYQQNCLTLNALKLATSFLREGGWFITKIFRSKDYNALLWVFKNLFKKVHATKPSASRKESAEIFVVCQFYIAPAKIDPKFLDSKYVFEELELTESKSINLLKNNKLRIKAEGYTEKDFNLRNELKATDFIKSENALEALNGISEITIDDEKIRSHPKTTDEILECCKDIKVLGRKDIKNILSWWKSLRETFAPKKPEENENDEKELTVIKHLKSPEELEEEELNEMEKHIADVELEELKQLKRKKRKSTKDRAKMNEKLNLKMILRHDEGPREEMDDMFDIKKFSHVSDLSVLDDQVPDETIESDPEVDTFRPKYVRFEKDATNLDDDGAYHDKIDEFSDDEIQNDEELSDYNENGLGLSDSDDENKRKNKKNKKTVNPLLVDLDNRDKDLKRKHRVQLWFEKDTLKNLNEEENEDYDLDKLAYEYKNKGVQVLGNEKSKKFKPEAPIGKKAKRRARHSDSGKLGSDSDTSSSDDDEEVKKIERPQKIVKLSEEELALGTMLVTSQKSRRDIIDGAWNRYASNDENLPDWFVQDEQQHMRKDLPVPEELVESYRQQLQELNIRPIKKVMEAKARKKRRAGKRFEKAKKKAEAILDNADASSQEKIRQIKKLYKKAADKKPEVTYVVAKKYSSAKRMRRPPNVKGRFKVVDKRMKKETRAKKVQSKKKK